MELFDYDTSQAEPGTGHSSITQEIECLAWEHGKTAREIAALLEIDIEEVRAVIKKNEEV
jgi:DNA-binding CsgD family transcriptional regulator